VAKVMYDDDLKSIG